MKKISFVCETTYNLFIAIILLFQLKQIDDIDVTFFVRNNRIKKELIDNLKTLKEINNVKEFNYSIFNDVYEKKLITVYYFSFMNYVFPFYFFNKFLQNKGEKYKFDEIYIAFPDMIERLLVRLNAKSKLFFYEDGIGNYVEFTKRFPLYTCFTEDLWSFIHFRKNKWKNVDGIFLNQPDCFDYDLIEKFKINNFVGNNMVENALNTVFSTQENTENYYSNKMVFFTQPDDKSPFLGRSYKEIEIKIINMLNNEFHDSIIVRIHPRDDSIIDNVKVDNSNNMFELMAKDYVDDETIMISYFSTACFTPKLIYDKEPYIIFLYMLFDVDQLYRDSYKVFLDRMKKLYKSNNKIFIPKTDDELIDSINYIKRNNT